jgi:hypothetical protein
MSGCMRTSAKCFPKVQVQVHHQNQARCLVLASRRTSTAPLWPKHTTSRARWNSSSRPGNSGNPGGKFEAGVAKRSSKGWTSFSVLGLMAAAAFGAHGFAKYQAEARELKMRDYSSPEKWLEPKYASRKDMEDVSFPETLLKNSGEVFFFTRGSLFGDWGHLDRQHRQSAGSMEGWDGLLHWSFLFYPSPIARNPGVDGFSACRVFLEPVLTRIPGNQRNSCCNRR